MTSPKKWNRHEILAALHAQGMTLTGLRKVYGMSKYAFANIWSRKNGKEEQAIARFLNVPVEELFPDRYPKSRHRILNKPLSGKTERQTAAPSQEAF